MWYIGVMTHLLTIYQLPEVGTHFQGTNTQIYANLTIGYTPGKTNECPLKMNGWKMYFPLKWCLF